MGIPADFIISGPDFTALIPDCSLGEYLIPRMKSHPKDNIIQVDFETGVSETSSELLKKSLGVAEGLLDIGLQQNDVVVIVSQDRSELYAAALGVIWAGGAAAPIGPKWTTYEMKHMIELLQPKYVFYEDETIERVEKVLSLLEMDTPIILLDSRKDEETFCRTFEKLIKDVDIETYKPRSINSPSTQLALIMPSGGSTGLPKGVGLTHRNVIFQLETWEYYSHSLIKLTEKPFLEMSAVHFAPFIWISTAVTVFTSVAFGLKRIFIKETTDEKVLQAIHIYKPIWFVAPPLVANSLMNHPNFKKYDVSSIKWIACGGASVSEYLIKRVKKDWNEGTTLEQLYGMTEAGGLITQAYPINVVSVGKLGPGIKLKVVDLETKKPLGPNHIGEFYIKSEGVMKCYVGNPDATKETVDADGWLHTGDLGYYDNHEALYIVDRVKEMIKVQTQKSANHVSPQELENLIQTLPGVSDVGVVGIPNEINMHHPMALVVKEKKSKVSEDDVMSIVKENLSDCKHLRGGVKFVDSIPRTPAGKIKRSNLKKLAQSLFSQ